MDFACCATKSAFGIEFTSGTVLVLIGEFIGRGLFYGLHMTVGMAVA